MAIAACLLFLMVHVDLSVGTIYGCSCMSIPWLGLWQSLFSIRARPVPQSASVPVLLSSSVSCCGSCCMPVIPLVPCLRPSSFCYSPLSPPLLSTSPLSHFCHLLYRVMTVAACLPFLKPRIDVSCGCGYGLLLHFCNSMAPSVPVIVLHLQSSCGSSYGCSHISFILKLELWLLFQFVRPMAWAVAIALLLSCWLHVNTWLGPFRRSVPSIRSFRGSVYVEFVIRPC